MSILESDRRIRNDLYGNIVLSGGTTILPGFVGRMQKELKLLSPGTKVSGSLSHPLLNVNRLRTGQDYRPSRAEVFCLDWWFHPGVA